MRFDLLSAVVLIALEGCGFSSQYSQEDILQQEVVIEAPESGERMRISSIHADPNASIQYAPAVSVIPRPVDTDVIQKEDSESSESDVQFDEEISSDTLVKLQRAARRANGKVETPNDLSEPVVVNDKFLRLHLVKFALDSIYGKREKLYPYHNNRFDMVWMLQLYVMMDIMSAWKQLRFNDEELTDLSADIFGDGVRLTKEEKARQTHLLHAEKQQLESVQRDSRTWFRTTAFQQMQEIIGMFPRTEYEHANRKQWMPGMFSPVIEAICILIYHIPAELRDIFLEDLHFVQWQPGSNYADLLYVDVDDSPEDALVSATMIDEIRRRVNSERIGSFHCPAKKFTQILRNGELLSTSWKAVTGRPDMSYREEL